MSLTFVNQYSFTPGYELNVAFMRFDRASCSDGDGFVTVGWYIVPPGGSKTVYTGDVNYNRYWAYYAECPKDGTTWTGDLRGWVSSSAFRLCHGRSCTPCRVVGFRWLDVNNYTNYTMTLTRG
jgi:uncharacterized membrane protein